MTKYTKPVMGCYLLMGTAFTDNEKVLIREKLHRVAQECLQQYGIKKTTVDQIVREVGISKGSFYNFYPGKEILFFVVLEEYQKSLIERLSKELEVAPRIDSDIFSAAIFKLYRSLKESFVITIIKNRELDYLMRKLPPELIADHHSLDELLLEQVFSYLRPPKNISTDVIAAALRALFMILIHAEEVGEEYMDQVLQLLTQGLAQQIISGDVLP